MRTIGIVCLFLPAVLFMMVQPLESLQNINKLQRILDKWRPKKADQLWKLLSCIINLILQWVLVPVIYVFMLSIVLTFKLHALPKIGVFFFPHTRGKAFNLGILTELSGESAPQLSIMVLNTLWKNSVTDTFLMSVIFSGVILVNGVYPIVYAMTMEEEGLSKNIFGINTTRDAEFTSEYFGNMFDVQDQTNHRGRPYVTQAAVQAAQK
jgi:hypothetical protein